MVVVMTPRNSDPGLKARLLKRIARYCRRAGISESRLANMVVNDGDFVRRLREGGDCTLATFEKFNAWLADAEGALRKLQVDDEPTRERRKARR